MSAGSWRNWERHRDGWILVTAVVLSLLFMAAQNSAPVRLMRRGVTGIVGILQESVAWLPRSLRVHEENKRLTEELGRLSLMETRFREEREENRRLRRLLGFKESQGFDVFAAEVTGRGTAGLHGSVWLNVGLKDGCRKDLVIMTDQGLVGRLISVSRDYAVGQTITDPGFRLSAKVQRSRVLGIVRWLHGNVCMLEGVPLLSDVQPGDMIVTSGYSRIYPEGLPVGTVFSVSPDEGGLFTEVLLRTAVDFGTLEELLVLKAASATERRGKE